MHCTSFNLYIYFGSPACVLQELTYAEFQKGKRSFNDITVAMNNMWKHSESMHGLPAYHNFHHGFRI
jgi:hypothetical protein